MLQENFYNKFISRESKCIIALDGTSASGKGTLAKLIASNYSFMHCQSSIFYRKLALDFLRQDKAEAPNLETLRNQLLASELLKENYQFLAANNGELYSEVVTRMTSMIAAIPEVRQFLLKPQRDFLNINERVIMEGRDIGTVIAPSADIKIYITASIEVRAKRRYDQMIANGKEVEYEDILYSLKERDDRDQGRAIAPLKKAEDAIEIDTTEMSIEQVLITLLHEIKKL